jgi:purine-binding chemotaxis protein CheW
VKLPHTPRPEFIDWKEVHRRLGKARQSLEEALQLPPERARLVMEERARALARVPQSPTAQGERLEFVVFSLANERYGISTAYVREVIRLTDLTPLPGAPDFVAGVTNLRGQVLAVMDLRKFFGVAVRGLSDTSRVVVLGGERPEFGVLADAVHHVLTLPIDQVLDPPESVAGIARGYLRGVTGDALVLLEGSALLQDSRLIIDQAVDQGA